MKTNHQRFQKGLVNLSNPSQTHSVPLASRNSNSSSSLSRTPQTVLEEDSLASNLPRLRLRLVSARLVNLSNNSSSRNSNNSLLQRRVVLVVGVIMRPQRSLTPLV